MTRTVAALCVTGRASFLTAIFVTGHGMPAGPGGGCAYRVASGGVYTCVSKTAYDLAGAGEQRMVAGIFLFFFAIHLYAALAAARMVYRQHKTESSSAEGSGDPGTAAGTMSRSAGYNRIDAPLCRLRPSWVG